MFELKADDSQRIPINSKLVSTVFYLVIFVLVISFQNEAQNKSNPNDEIFELGMLKNSFVNVNMNDAKVAMTVWARELTKQLNINVEFKLDLFDNTEELIKYNEKGNLGMVILNSIDFLKLRSKMNLQPILISTDSKNIYNKLLIITRDENVKDISDLRNKKIGFYLKRNNPVPKLWLDELLYKNKLGTKEKFFSLISNFQSESQLILSVFFGQTNAGVVTESSFQTMCELNPQVSKQLKIIMTSPNFIYDISSLTQNSKRFSFSKRIIEIAAKIDTYAAGKEILTLMKTTQEVPYKPQYMVATEKLFNEWEAIKK